LSILTKIAIVLLVLLVIPASILFINMAMVTPNYRAAYEREQEKRMAVEVTARQSQIVKATSDHMLDKARADHASEKSTSVGIITDVKSQLTKAKLGLADEKSKVAKASAVADDLRTINAQQLALLKEKDADLKATLVRKDDLASKIRGIEEALAASETRVTRGEMTEETLRQQLDDCSIEIRQLNVKLDSYKRHGISASTGSNGIITDSPAVTAGKIIATITTYKNRIATIDAGSTKGVSKGMMLHIYRGTTLVGKLEISDVQADRAGGVVIDQSIDPQAGDKVTNTFQN